MYNIHSIQSDPMNKSCAESLKVLVPLAFYLAVYLSCSSVCRLDLTYILCCLLWCLFSLFCLVCALLSLSFFISFLYFLFFFSVLSTYSFFFLFSYFIIILFFSHSLLSFLTLSSCPSFPFFSQPISFLPSFLPRPPSLDSCWLQGKWRTRFPNA